MTDWRTHDPLLGKVRLGARNDGGYVVADCGPYDFYIGAGIGDDCSFDRDFLRRFPGVPAVALDGTITRVPKDFPAGLQWVPENAGSGDDMRPLATGVDGFLKMDIEGGEWWWLESVGDDVLRRFKQVVIEFHGLHDQTSDKMLLMSRLLQHFRIVHVHANNYGGTFLRGSNRLARVLEVTFLRKGHSLPGEQESDLDRPNSPWRPEIQLPPNVMLLYAAA